MPELKRPSLDLKRNREPIDIFVGGLQRAIDAGDADRFNQQFAEDVLWGSPFGAVAVGYDQIHAIHTRMFASILPSKGASQYSVEHIRFPLEDVALAYVRRTSKHSAVAPDQQQPGSFDELALFVLVRRDGDWWLAAGQHVPDRREVYSQSKSPKHDSTQPENLR
jgi:uncharacterized protein (TIGR02246 family)